jgi:hypothetical protein
MPIVHFKGYLLPLVHNLTIDLPLIGWNPREPSSGDFKVQFAIKVTESRVDVTCDLSQYDFAVHFPALYMRVHDLTRAAVDCFCFARGVGLTVFLDTVIGPDGVESPIVPQMESLSRYCTAFNLNANSQDEDSYSGMVGLVLSEPPLMMALNDLIVSITVHHHAPINCMRAIDGIRNMMSPLGTDPSVGWRVVQSGLNVSKNYLSYVAAHSKAPRHGDRTYIEGQIVQEVINRSWIVMNRFLEFRKRANSPLTDPEFLLLDG